MNTDSMDSIFAALASAARRRMLDRIRDAPGCNLKTVCADFDVTRVAVMKHLAVLEKAGLIVSRKTGRERTFHFNPVPIQLIHERWTSEYSAYWAGKLTAFKYRLEQGEGD